MKILIYSDPHNSNSSFQKIREMAKKEKPDLIICTGDLTWTGDIEELKHALKQAADVSEKVILLHGNHEEEDATRLFAGKFPNLIFLHKETIQFDDILFIVHGGGGFSYRDEEFEEWAKELEPQIKAAKRIILLTHQPPYGTKLDIVVTNHVGSKSYTDFIAKHAKKILFAQSGHIHDCFGATDRIKGALCISPGPYGVIMKV